MVSGKHVILNVFFVASLSAAPVYERSDIKANVAAAITALQRWYNEDSGLYIGTSWWNAANCITTLAEYTLVDPSISTVTTPIWRNTFDGAQRFNRQHPNGCPSTGCLTKRTVNGGESQEYFHSDSVGSSIRLRASSLKLDDADPKGFLNPFFDDAAWWAHAWIRIFDLTRERTYLKAAQYIYDDLEKEATNAKCGGVWWDRKKSANTAISNELYLLTAAALANRVPEERERYLNAAVKQWQWFEGTGMINERNQINDGLNLETCKNNMAEVWSYNQGVIIGALLELNKATHNATLIRRASDIADAALKYQTDKDGVFHDLREPDLGGDGYQFKGVFARHLKELYKVTKNPAYRTFLEVNAESVWNRARNTTDNTLTGTWSGPWEKKHSPPSAHCSALDVLVGAAAVLA